MACLSSFTVLLPCGRERAPLQQREQKDLVAFSKLARILHRLFSSRATFASSFYLSFLTALSARGSSLRASLCKCAAGKRRPSNIKEFDVRGLPVPLVPRRPSSSRAFGSLFLTPSPSDPNPIASGNSAAMKNRFPEAARSAPPSPNEILQCFPLKCAYTALSLHKRGKKRNGLLREHRRRQHEAQEEEASV
ncbi:hypothetical protein MRX96_021251 [Rhipicephalus microplus]